MNPMSLLNKKQPLCPLCGTGGLEARSHSAFLQIGFFKRKLKEKMEADGDTPNGLPGADSEPLASDKEALEPLQGEKAEEKDKA